ncbi:hypothetical protein B0H10DRAFT_2352141 [Mycena sp. CBHHK59/15]|nr:hypothetical protein B0H10DRAFT_2352141 [Mycena sp. CBHHK59/15]
MYLDPLPPPQPPAANPPTPQDLHKAIHDVTLPKSKTAKTCSVPIDDWNTIRALAASLLLNPSLSADSARISSLSTKLDALASKLDFISTQNPQTTPTFGPPPKSYASVAAKHPATSLITRIPRDTSREITLTPKDRRTKAFANDTHHAIQQQLNALISESRLAHSEQTIENILCTG